MLTGISIVPALLLSAQLACWGMCTYILLLLRRWRISPAMIAVTFLLIFSYPSAFFLVSGYSESLFLCMLLGMIYWQGRTSSGSRIITIVHGFVMSAARVHGLALDLYPLLRIEPGRNKRTFTFKKAIASCVMMLGGLSFFLYCASRFGNWHLYFDSKLIGWGQAPQYTAIYHLSTYQLDHLWLHIPSLGEVGLLSVPFATAWFFILLLIEGTLARKRDPSGWKDRLGLCFCAFVIFFVSISSSGSIGWQGLIRFQLGTHIMLVLVTMHLLSRLRLTTMQTNAVLGFLCVLSLLLLKLHVEAADTFMQGGWVAGTFPRWQWI